MTVINLDAQAWKERYVVCGIKGHVLDPVHPGGVSLADARKLLAEADAKSGGTVRIAIIRQDVWGAYEEQLHDEAEAEESGDE